MRRNGLKGGLLFTTSLMTAALGYGRKAYANCVATPVGSTTYSCSGIPAGNAQYSFNGASGINVSVSLNPTTVFTTGGAGGLSGNAITITGDGNLALVSRPDVYLFSFDGAAAYIRNPNGGTAGNINVNTQFRASDAGAPYYGTDWGFTGDDSGLTAINDANGALNLTLNNRLEGNVAGVIAQHNGTGNITITVGNATVGVPDGSITATGLGSADHGLIADHNGTGNISITVNGDITAAGGDGVNASTSLTGTGITVNIGDGDISGGQNGVFANHTGSVGGVSILATSPTAPGTVTGLYGDGINARNSGAAGIIIQTGSGDIIGGANGGNQSVSGIDAQDFGTGGITITVNESDVTGDAEGVLAQNSGGGGIQVTTYAGNILGRFGKGIEALNAGGTSITITTGTGTVTGNVNDGIIAGNTGSGGITVTTGSGDIKGGANAGNQLASGIEAQDFGAGGITITVNESDVTGDAEGVRARNAGGGAVAITTNAGNILGQFGQGIDALNYGGTSVAVTTGSGTVTGNADDGIFVQNTGTGGITITTGSGDITGGADAGDQSVASGIEVRDYGTGGITITVNDSKVTGDAEGVRANNNGGGSVEITTNAGNILGQFGQGIDAVNSGGLGGITITTGSGTVIGNTSDGIAANNSGAGGITIITGTGNIIGGAAAGVQGNANGILATDIGSGSVTITANESDVTGDTSGIAVRNYGGGDTTVTTNDSDITGTGASGILVRNRDGIGFVQITTNDGAILGGLYGIDAANSGIGTLSITTGDGDITGTTFDGIRAFGGTTSTGVSITLNGAADVTGGKNGILGFTGGGPLTIDASAATGVITGNTGDGIRAEAYATATGGITITTGAGAGGVAVDGDLAGIFSNNAGGGGITITTGAGSVTGKSEDGIYTRNSGSDGIITTTGTGDITGGAASGEQFVSGINARDYGTGGITITVNDSNVTGDAAGVLANNRGGGSIEITTNAGNILGEFNRGIQAFNYAGTSISIETGAGTVTGNEDDGIYARNEGTGGITITTGTGDIIGGKNVGFYTFSAGIEALDNGAGAITITVNDSDVTGGYIGVQAQNSGGGSIEITTNAGDILGNYGKGISAVNTVGTGGITITTGTGTVTGNIGEGILAKDYDTGGITITVNDGDVTGTLDAVRAENSGGGSIAVTTNAGNILGSYNGIIAENGSGLGGIEITTGAGTVTGKTGDGILAGNSGDGGIIITTGAGDITGGADAGNQYSSGIDASDYGSGGITITVNDSNVTGDGQGIYAYNSGGGAIEITTNTGNILSLLYGPAIDATNSGGLGGITITTGAGTVTSNKDDGISADNSGDGGITITTGTGDITGGAAVGAQTSAFGIRAADNGTGGITITVNDSDVTGDGTGISAANNGYGGDVTITTNNGNIRALVNDAIAATNGVDGGDLTITTNDGSVSGGRNGIRALNSGTGLLAITIGDGDITGTVRDGIDATADATSDGIEITLAGSANVTGGDDGISAATSGGDILIDASAATGVIDGQGNSGIVAIVNSGSYADITISTGAGALGVAVIGGDAGILAQNYGYGSIEITTGEGSITGNGSAGIAAYADAYALNITITTGTGAVTGEYDGIDADNRGFGYLTITTYGEVRGRYGNGIEADNGDYYYGAIHGTDLTITTEAYVVGGGGDGIRAKNEGDGNLVITTNAVVRGDGGNGITARNGYSYASSVYGIDMIITTNDLVSGSYAGIDAQNRARGELQIRTYDDVIGEDSDGIRARNGTLYNGIVHGTNMDITTDGQVLGKNGDGMEAANYGTGSLTITTYGLVDGDNGDGIRARNGGVYTYAYGTNLTITTEAAVIGSSRGISAINYGTGSIDISVGGDVTGEDSRGIFARNGADGTTLDVSTDAGTTVIGKTFGISAVNYGTGDITVDVAGDAVTGSTYTGISTYGANGGDTIITVSADSTVQGFQAAIGSSNLNGELIDIDSAGVLQNLSGLDTDAVVVTVDGKTDLTNTGQMTGWIDFGGFDDTLTNSGTWNVGGTSKFGAGSDKVDNTNLMIAANAAGVSETTVFNGLESFTNSGVIRLADETAGNGSTSFDTLEITGNFIGVGGTLAIDAVLGPVGGADLLVISGAASGTTGIDIQITGGTGSAGSSILLVDTGSSVETAFFLANGPINLGAYVYDLFWDGQDFFLQSSLDILRLDAATFPAILGDLWDISASGWHRNTVQLQNAEAGGLEAGAPDVTLSSKGTGRSGAIKGWGTLILDQRSSEGTILSDVAGTPTAVDIAFDQTTRAFIGGVDLTLTPDAVAGQLTFGVLLGAINSTVDFDLTGNQAKFDGPTYGMHVAYATDAFRADLILKRDDLDLEYAVTGLSDEPGRANAVSTGASLEFGYKVHESATMTVEAIGNLSHVSTRIDAFSVGSSNFTFDNADTTRGAVGLSVRGNYTLGNTNFIPSATVKYWNVFDGGYTSAIDAVAFSYDGTGQYLEASATLEFADPNSGWSGFVSGSGFLGGERSGARAQVGVNIEW